MSENTNVNATDNVNTSVAASVDQGELQGVEAQEAAKAKRRQRLSRKADDKASKGKGEPAPESNGKGKGKGKGSPEPIPEPTPTKGKSKGLSLKIKDGRIVNVKDVFAATNNGKPYAVSRFIIRLLTAVLGKKWTRKVGEGTGDGLEYHWAPITDEESKNAIRHVSDAAKALGYKLGTGNGDGDGCILVEPDGKANSKQQRLVFAY